MYFHATFSWWPPLWKYTCTLAGDALPEDLAIGGMGNNGTYIPAASARELAKRLERALRSGAVDEEVRRAGDHFDKELVRRFKNFCKSSGGFRIS